ncbi:alpha carbonic anhydrase 1, chloroplastic-like [Wolffia australiana]
MVCHEGYISLIVEQTNSLMATLLVTWVLALLPLLNTASSAPGYPRFSYEGNTGPQKWGELSKEYSLCANGTRQSPIDIVTAAAVVDTSLKPLCSAYNAANATLVDNGFNVMVKYGEEAGVIVIDGKDYKLGQVHWHSPAEHTIDGVRYPVEIHLVHVNANGGISIVAILYKYGQPDPFLSQLKEIVGLLSKEVHNGNPHANVTAGVVGTKALAYKTCKYYRYVGSLTTPPCTENVIWNVLGKVMEMSEEQATSLSSLLERDCRHNSRPTQLLNGRKTLLCHGAV